MVVLPPAAAHPTKAPDPAVVFRGGGACSKPARVPVEEDEEYDAAHPRTRVAPGAPSVPYARTSSNSGPGRVAASPASTGPPGRGGLGRSASSGPYKGSGMGRSASVGPYKGVGESPAAQGMQGNCSPAARINGPGSGVGQRPRSSSPY